MISVGCAAQYFYLSRKKDLTKSLPTGLQDGIGVQDVIISLDTNIKFSVRGAVIH